MKSSFRLVVLLALLTLSTCQSHESDESIPDSGIGDESSSFSHENDDDFNLHREESRNLRARAYQTAYVPNNVPTGFRPSPEIPEHPIRRPILQDDQSYINLVPVRQNYEQQQPTRVPHRKPQQEHRPSKKEELQEEIEDEKEEPDRLSMLLQNSKFDCRQKQTGYYADEELACEVFHYCQEGVKHSWICPNGFTFHQVHLICMPPSGDTICAKSSKYHFVNEYLYRPINADEAQRKPNVTLKYSDRYFPSDIYHDDRYEEDNRQIDDEEPPRHKPQPVAIRQHPASQNHGQVFRSPEEINIPLIQRRPQPPPSPTQNYPTQRPSYSTASEFDYN